MNKLVAFSSSLAAFRSYGVRAMALACTLAVGLPGCGSDSIGCRVDSECASGMSCANGECVKSGDMPDDLSAKVVDASMSPGDMALPGAPDGFTFDADTSSCPFNNDGIIQRAEIPAMAGLGGFFDVNAPGQTSTVNVVKANGIWDFSAVGAGDEKVFDGLTTAAGQWWSASYPTASYAQLADSTTGLLGVYKIDATSLQLLGLVSPTSGLTSTNISYDPPITVLSFPVSSTSTWTTTSTVSGTYSGVAYLATQTWGFSVDDTGTVKTPAADFKSLRIRLDFSQLYFGVTTTQISYLFITECYGVITRIRSNDNETSPDFTTATEYRRLAAP